MAITNATEILKDASIKFNKDTEVWECTIPNVPGGAVLEAPTSTELSAEVDAFVAQYQADHPEISQ